MRLSDRFKLISTFSKPLKKWHDFLCDRSKHYRNWHYNPYHKHVHWSTLSLVTTLLISLMLNAIPEKSNAAYAFIANYDNNTIDATYAVGNQPAYYDTQSATIITPGVGDAGGAALVTGNQQLKYRLRNNLDASTGQIEMNFKMPYGLTGTDDSIGKFNGPRYLSYDPASEYYYISDYTNHRIVKTKIDGTGWQTLGSVGGGIGQFYYPCGIYYDSTTDYIYVADRSNNRIVKTKIDGTGWTSFGVAGSAGIGKFSSPNSLDYDSATGFFI